MTEDEFKAGLSSVKLYWNQWRQRLEQPGAEAVMMVWWKRLQRFTLRSFEEAIMLWVETRNSVPTINSLADLTEESESAYERAKALEARGEPQMIRPGQTKDWSVDDLVWARFHCYVVEQGLNRNTAKAQERLAEAYIKLGERYPALSEACNREGYAAQRLAQGFRLHPEREGKPTPPTAAGFTHANPGGSFQVSDQVDVSEDPGQEVMRL